jgi:hypothetical protein
VHAAPAYAGSDHFGSYNYVYVPHLLLLNSNPLYGDKLFLYFYISKMQLRSSMHWLTMKLATLVQLSVICITRSPICASCEKNRKKGSPVHVDPACAESGGGSHHSGSYKYIPHLLLLNSNPLYGEHLFLNFYISKMQLRSSMHWHRMKLMTLARSLVICTTRSPIRVSCEKNRRNSK